ncbi:MAG: hypothetical protein HY301_19325, partial [Verrucomicrobia bacterium]|nr:hypothetical protein [Verrucomicrobiota bacterium]
SLVCARWRLAHPGEIFGNENGGLCWAFPLPPFGAVHVARVFPVSVSPAGVLAHTAESPNPAGRPQHAGKFFRWEQIETIVADGKKLRVNGGVFWRSDSVYAPAHIAKWLRELKALPEGERAARITRELAARFDPQAIAARREALVLSSRWLGVLCEMLFLYLFLLCPVTVWLRGWLPALWWMIPLLLAQTIGAAVLFVRAHRRLFPDAGDERFRLAIIFALAPAATIRAGDALARPLLENFHPLAVAKVLLDEKDFAAAARRGWRDVNFPLLPTCPIAGADASATEEWFRRAQQSPLETFLGATKLPAATWQAAPAASDPAHAKFCPRCEAQFTATAAACDACGGRALEPLPQGEAQHAGPFK